MKLTVYGTEYRRAAAGRRAKALALALLMLFVCALGPSCAAERPAERELFLMDTYMKLRAYGGKAEEGLDEACALMSRLDSLLSVTNENSEIFALNAGSGQPTPVSEETFELLSIAARVSAKLGDSFEITLRPVSKAWGFTDGPMRVPSDEELASLLPLVDDDKLTLDPDVGAVTLPAGMQIDLGALAKGYAADKAADLLKESGTEAALLDLGSSTILAFGSKPDGTKWKIAVQDPKNPGVYAGTLGISSGSVSTSGGYERYFEQDGRVYWHILDPRTGRPADSGLLSVTVLSGSAAEGDALSTAIFVMGVDKALELRRDGGGFEFIAIAADRIYATPGAGAVFTPMGEYAEVPLEIVN